MTGYITTSLYKSRKPKNNNPYQKNKKFKFDAKKYIYSNIEKPWWSSYFKDNELEILSVKDQRKKIINHIRNVVIDPC